MNFLFGESHFDKVRREVRERSVRETDRMLANLHTDLNTDLHTAQRKEIGYSLNKINDIIKKIKAKIQELIPNIDMDLFLKLQKDDQIYENEERVKVNDYFNIKFDELSYNQFIAYKFREKIHYKLSNFDELDQYTKNTLPLDFIGEDYNDYLDVLNKINPDIFMRNVNIDWQNLQLAKKNISILYLNSKQKSPSPPKRSSPPKPPPLPSASKRSSPKKSKSKITAETLQTAKSKLKSKPKSKSPSPPKKRSSPDPTDPNYELEMAFRNLEKKQESKKK